MSYNLGQIDPDERTRFYADPNDEEADPQPRRVLRILGALLVMTLFAGGLWFAYVEGARHAGGSGDGGDIPLIRADARPIKVKPADPGGMPIPDRNMLIYSQNRPIVEHLLPPPERPIALPRPPPPPPTPIPAASAPVGAPPTAVPSTVAPGTAPAGAAARPEQLAGLAPANSRPTASQPAEAVSQPGKGGGVRLQLGAVRSEGVAREEWARIKRSNPDLLGHLTAVAIRADLGDKGVYYRIQAGPVADPAAAERLCGELRQRHLACIIVR
jgi:cell division septation protein DedD